MTLQELCTSVSRDLTSSCVLPATVPPKEIERIVQQQKKWFYDNYDESVEDCMFIIPKSEFSKPEFKKYREFVLPDNVYAVVQAPTEIKGHNLYLLTKDADLSADRLWASQIYMSPLNGDELVMRVAQYHFFDLSQAMTVTTLAFSYNNLTHKIKILGRDPQYDVYIRVASKIPDEKLFEDYYFQRWITAKAKISLASILGRYNFNLMGEVSINYADIKDEGKEELDEIKQTIADKQTPDHILLWNG